METFNCFLRWSNTIHAFGFFAIAFFKDSAFSPNLEIRPSIFAGSSSALSLLPIL